MFATTPIQPASAPRAGLALPRLRGVTGTRWVAGALLAVVLATLGGGVLAQSMRIKEVAAVQGVRSNQLTGYGLVVGLDGTGD
ncbi:MAG: flagellar basal body P-ring protein FlgI, partial [Burkholderiaceae bacterium]|nr:flagellar basal body P-ring protein FlgI [Burkholderiaceae bacterium]